MDPLILTKLYKYCAYQDRCRSEIEDKLRDFEVDPLEWENILAHLEDERFWNEERYARSYVRGKFRIKRWGKIKIQQALKRKRVPVPLIQLALAEEIDTEAYENALDHIAERKLKDLQREEPLKKKQKLIRFLQQRGFEWDVIQRRIGLLLTIICLFSLFWVRCSSPPVPKYASLDPSTQYVGMETCASCHENTYRSYQQTGMGHSLYLPDRDDIIERFGPEEVVYDPQKNFYYLAAWQGEEMFIKEFRLQGQDTVFQRTEKVSFIVGSGHQTRSYLMERNGYWYEMPITWYVEKQIWDLSPGYKDNNSRFAREIGQECLSCHTGHNEYLAGSKNRFAKVAHGIGCEKCHGPGSVHVELAEKEQLPEEGTDYSIVTPSNLPIGKQFDICQQCHLQGVNVYRPGKSIADYRPGMALTEVMDVFIERPKNANAFGIASHAERLMASQCFIQSAGKLTCTTCHNPHKSISVTDPKRYVRQCTNCHASTQATVGSGAVDNETVSSNSGRSGQWSEAKSVSGGCSAPQELQMTKQGDCISCHMPQGETRDIPHVSFHDHKIRVLRKTDSIDIDEIRDFLRLQLATQETAPDSIWGQAWLLYFERHENSGQYLREAVAQLADGPTYPKAQAAFFSRRFEEALALINDHVQKQPDDAFGHYLHGETLEVLGQFAEAQQAYARAFLLQPESVEAGLKEVVTLLKARQGDVSALSTAANRLAELEQRKPFDERILTNLAFVRLNQGKLNEAENLLNRALALDPDYQLAKDNLSLLNRLR
jgi:SOS response regulatory protein OraA/RecX